MMFRVWGHPNITAKHKTTLEFTKEDYVSPKGDCIIGIRATFRLAELKRFIKANDSVKITLRIGGLTEKILAKTNPDFNDDKEMVIRLGEYASPRTFAIRADKASKHLNPEMIKVLRKGSPMEVDIEKATE